MAPLIRRLFSRRFFCLYFGLLSGSMYAMIDSAVCGPTNVATSVPSGDKTRVVGRTDGRVMFKLGAGIINDVKGNSEIIGVRDECLADFAIKVHAEDHHIFNLIQLI